MRKKAVRAVRAIFAEARLSFQLFTNLSQVLLCLGIGCTKIRATFPEFMGLQSGELDQNVRDCYLAVFVGLGGRSTEVTR